MAIAQRMRDAVAKLSAELRDYKGAGAAFSKYSSVPMVDYVKAQASKVSLANIDKLPG